MNETLESPRLQERPSTLMSPDHERLMREHLRDENLPEAVMPACPVVKALKGQKALVTGANSGIGQAVALALAHAGADVVVNYVSRPDAAEHVVKEAMRCGSMTENTAKADANWPGLVAKNGAYGGKTLVFLNKRGVALEGYDPVSYFTDGKPAKGDPKIEATFDGALYHFVSQAHRETFEKDPTKYAPAYGGYCGYAASIGKVRPANPLLWSIVDGQLIVQHTKGAVELWDKDVAGNKSKADDKWPKLIEAKAGLKNPVDSLLGRSVLDSKSNKPQARNTPEASRPWLHF